MTKRPRPFAFTMTLKDAGCGTPGSAAAEAYIPLSFAPGEAYQFGWSHEIVLLDGVTVTVKVTHMRLCHSRMFFVRAYPSENHLLAL